MKIITKLSVIGLLLGSLSPAFASAVDNNVVNAAKDNLAVMTEIAQLSKNEQQSVYQVLLQKETEFAEKRLQHQDDKQALSAAIKELNPQFNRQLKDIVGGESMREYHQYIKKQKRKG